MDSTLLDVVIFSLIGGLISLLGGVILLSRKSTAVGLARYATPFAAGALLAAAFVDLLAEGIADAGLEGMNNVLLAALCGVLVFFVLERFLRWFHHHHEHPAAQSSSSTLIIIGDTLHNVLDGIAIAAAFLVSPSTGIVVTIAVAAHEIPQEIGDFGLLLKNGMRRRNVLLINGLSALSTTVAAVLMFTLGSSNDFSVEVLLGLTAGFFIYIAASDIIPEIHEQLDKKFFDIRPILLLVGALFVLLVNRVVHQYIDTRDHDESTARATVQVEQQQRTTALSGSFLLQ